VREYAIIMVCQFFPATFIIHVQPICLSKETEKPYCIVESIPLYGGEMWPLFENLRGWRLNYFRKYLQIARVMEEGMKNY